MEDIKLFQLLRIFRTSYGPVVKSLWPHAGVGSIPEVGEPRSWACYFMQSKPIFPPIMLGIETPCYLGKYTSETQLPCPFLHCQFLTLAVILFLYTYYFKYRKTLGYSQMCYAALFSE